MPTIIISIAVVFVVVVVLFNFDKVKSSFKSSPKPKIQKEKKIDYDKKVSKSALNYDEKDFNKKKVDNLNHEDDGGMPFVMANEEELKELTSKPKNEGGRLRGAIVRDDLSRNEVQVEDLGEYEESDAWDGDNMDSNEIDDAQADEDDLFAFLDDDYESEKSISEQIKSLPPEIKALLLTNVLDKRDENK